MLLYLYQGFAEKLAFLTYTSVGELNSIIFLYNMFSEKSVSSEEFDFLGDHYASRVEGDARDFQ